jgi:glycosyltransferase involved in cell wall biosynthesis
MFGGFGHLPKGKGTPEKKNPIQPPVIHGKLEGGPSKGSTGKLGVVQQPVVNAGKLEGGPSKTNTTPEVVIRVTPGVAGPGAPTLGKVDAKVVAETVGKKVLPLQGPYVMTQKGRGGVYKYWISRKEFAEAKAQGRVGIRWVAPIFDESGYGEACRNYIAAIAGTGFPITTRAISLGEPSTDYGYPGKVSLRTLNIGHPCAINLVYSPPHFFKDHRDPDAYNIGMFVWEMNGLPGEWVTACNQMNEIWVPCEWNAKVVRASSVKVPVFVFGHCVAPEEYNNLAPMTIPNLEQGLYKFYSIFQWSTRKNPQGLLRAYLRAFTNKDPVILIMKTYGQKYTGSEEKKVRAEIENIRREVGGSQPKILLITKMLSKAQILGLHKLGDCFFLPHRAEGWGLPHFEACMTGKPVITTNYGGNLEFTKPEHSYLVPSRPVYVSGMEWFKWFTPEMTWADADVNACINALRHVFENQKEAAEKGAQAQDYVMKTFNWMTVGAAMKGRIEEIVRGL